MMMRFPLSLRSDLAEVRALLLAEMQLVRGPRLSLARAALWRLQQVERGLRGGGPELDDLLRHVEQAEGLLERAMNAPEPWIGILLALSELDVRPALPSAVQLS